MLKTEMRFIKNKVYPYDINYYLQFYVVNFLIHYWMFSVEATRSKFFTLIAPLFTVPECSYFLLLMLSVWLDLFNNFFIENAK